jgi:leucyl aminopeptidase
MIRALSTIAIVLCFTAPPAGAELTIRFEEPGRLQPGGVLVVPLPEDTQFSSGFLAPGAVSAIADALKAARFTGKARSSLPLYSIGGFEQVLVVGMGPDTLSPPALNELGGTVAQALPLERGIDAQLLWEGPAEATSPAADIALGVELGAYRFDRYKQPGEDAERGDSKLTILAAAARREAQVFSSQRRPVASAVRWARDQISEPANVVYPESFVTRARSAFRGVKNVSLRVLDEGDMAKRNMGALLGVGMGSERPPRLLVVEYRGGERKQAPLVFVGKGVTFDTGGISLKRSKDMWRMKYDMSGAAAVTGTVLALAGREAPVNAVAIAALVENMPSARAQRPGDVRTTASGKTIEITNTDAEGRLILADAIWYAQQVFEPALMVDVATLTGSVRVALGAEYAGLFTRHDDVAEQLLAAGRNSGEVLWRLPLHPAYRKEADSRIADIRNSVTTTHAGASIGAEVIGEFVDSETRWAHLDIAGMAWAFKARPVVPEGAAGFGIRLLNQLVVDSYE